MTAANGLGAHIIKLLQENGVSLERLLNIILALLRAWGVDAHYTVYYRGNGGGECRAIVLTNVRR